MILVEGIKENPIPIDKKYIKDHAKLKLKVKFELSNEKIKEEDQK